MKGITAEEVQAKSARNKAAWRRPSTMLEIIEAEQTARAEQAAKPKRDRKQEITRAQSNIEAMLEADIAREKLPPAKRNYRALADRKFEIDFAWPKYKLGCEVQGMAHRIKGRFQADIEKRALLLLDGWTILEVSGQTIRDGRAITWLQTLFKQEAPSE